MGIKTRKKNDHVICEKGKREKHCISIFVMLGMRKTQINIFEEKTSVELTKWEKISKGKFQLCCFKLGKDDAMLCMFMYIRRS